MASQIHTAALSDVGRVRSNNEDIFGIDAASGLYVVCDGMGGAAAGEVASRMACNTAISTFAEQPTATRLEDRLLLAIQAANTAVRNAAYADHRGMGTTLVAAAIAGNRLLIGNVGDSRAYILQQGGWEQVTSDHSYINELVQQGSIRLEDSHSPELQRFGSVITRAIGTANEVHPDFFPIDLSDGDTLLLASDGLTRYLDAVDFSALIDPSDLEGSCLRLIDSANSLGGIDNITCLLLRYTDHERPSQRITA